MRNCFAQNLMLRTEINNIDYDIVGKHVEDVRIKNIEGDSFHFKLENIFKMSRGYIKAMSLPTTISIEDFQNQYYLDADMAEVFKSQQVSIEFEELLRTCKIVYISQIFISPKYRNRGIGSKLIQCFHTVIEKFYKNENILIVLTVSPLGQSFKDELDFKETTSALNHFYSRLGYTDIRGSIVKYLKL